MTHAAPEMNTTPLIDVLLVLLTLLILTLPLTTHKIALQLPTSGKTSVTHPLVRVEIDFDGQVFWNGAVTESDKQLEQWFRGTADDPLTPAVHIVPDRRAPYERVAQVLAAAQRAHVHGLALSPVPD
jgi:biopolymer transport protein ExbD